MSGVLLGRDLQAADVKAAHVLLAKLLLSVAYLVSMTSVHLIETVFLIGVGVRVLLCSCVRLRSPIAPNLSLVDLCC